MARKKRRPRLAKLFEPYVWDWFERTFGKASPPQKHAWPTIAAGSNTLIFSPTGSGKTLAAFLWCINDLFRQEELPRGIQVLYVSPLKALNNDIQKNLVEPLAGIRAAALRAGVEVPDVRSAVRTGDTTQQERAAMARRPPHIFITTPESLFIILSTRKFREALRTVRYVIVDEIHAMSDNKRGVHLSLSLERLQHLADEPFTRIGLSATQRPLEEIARFLAGLDDGGNPRECQIVDVGARKNLDVQVVCPVDNLLESHHDAIWGSAYARMLDLIGRHDTTLVFTNSRFKTERTALRLNELAIDAPVQVGAHHGSMSKEVRLEMEDKLKGGKLDALVATSSLELGIDVGSIDLVCQIQSPKSVSSGLQRIGRAGHLLDATSRGRLLVTDRDDLVESAVLVRAILDGQIDRTRIPCNCLDVLAQHIVGAVAADPWRVDELYNVLRRSYCFRDLSLDDYRRVLDMLAGGYRFDVERPPFPKIGWDKVNDVLTPERAARMIAFRASGTIPDVADYDVYFEKKRTRVGQLDEGFVENLRMGDIFILGSSTWRVIGIRRNRVFVEDVYGRAPTIPYWGGDRDSRTYDLGLLVGRFRRELAEQLARGDPEAWLHREYGVDDYGAHAICEYFREQVAVTPDIPCDHRIVVEQFHDELGKQQLVIHSSFGIRVNDPWAMALQQAILDTHEIQVQVATVDDGILVTVPEGAELDAERMLALVTLSNLDDTLGRAVIESPVFSSRFRHNAVRSLLVLREYRGRRTPVWLQSLRATALLEACRDDPDCPVVAETLRECLHESLDVADLRSVLQQIADGDIQVSTLAPRVPSPFSHALLLVGQFGDFGTVPSRERRSRLMHLHRDILRQILDEETLRDLLDEGAVATVELRLQRTEPRRRARDANELARVLADLGDLLDEPDEEMSLLDRVDGELQAMLTELADSRRALVVSLPSVETSRQRWIATENFPEYRAAFRSERKLSQGDRKLLTELRRKGPCPPKTLDADAVDRLAAAFEVVRSPEGVVATAKAVPRKILSLKPTREAARRAIVERFLQSHGPVTKYEIMERYGFPEDMVERTLADLTDDGGVVEGEYVPTKSFPQWCARRNLEEIHRLTLEGLRREMEPASPEEYLDFLLRWQHVHPDTRLSGGDGLREVLGQLQGQENYQVVYERDVFPARVSDYQPWMLDRLCYGGEVVWRRLGYRDMKRGRVGFVFRGDAGWVMPDPAQTAMTLNSWDHDIGDACNAVRRFLVEKGACFYDEMLRETALEEGVALRAVWHLVWTGEATIDGFEAIRHARVSSGLSACYDLASRPGQRGGSTDEIAHRMREYRKLDPTLGRWAPTERLAPDAFEAAEPDPRAVAWARLLLRRCGIVCRESLRREVCAPRWGDVRRALIKMEMLGQVRRGFFVEDLPGEQYGLPQAVEALRDAKGGHDDDEPMILLDYCDPANVFHDLFPLTNQDGEPVKVLRMPQKYLVVQGGRPLLLYHGAITVLRDLTRDRAEQAMRMLLRLLKAPVAPHDEIALRDWNGHPCDVSRAFPLLEKLGFVPSTSRWKGFVCDGQRRGKEKADVPDVLERIGKEDAPVAYDAEWVVSRSPEAIRPKVAELIAFLENWCPEACEVGFEPRRFVVRYRGIKCMHAHIQLKKIWLHINHRGWSPGAQIEPDTDLQTPEFVENIDSRFDRIRQMIDTELDRRGARARERT